MSFPLDINQIQHRNDCNFKEFIRPRSQFDRYCDIEQTCKRGGMNMYARHAYFFS